jgi:hypothetical protein
MEDARKPILQIANKIEFQSGYSSKVAKLEQLGDLRIKICSKPQSSWLQYPGFVESI